jgi:c-di-GMP-binding flagellar brake protein YcgR
MSEEQDTPRAVKDDRRFTRFPLKVPVYIALEGGTFRKTIALECQDLSGGGLSFETSRKVPVHAKSKVVVSKLGDLGEPALIHGRVARTQKNPDTGRYTIGLEFIEFVNVTREDLLARIEAWVRDNPQSTPAP